MRLSVMFALTLGCLGGLGCGDSQPAARAATQAGTQGGTQAAARASARFVELPFDTTAAVGLPHVGTVVAGRRWRDAAGEHTLLLTQAVDLPSRVPAGELWVEGEPAYDGEVYGYHYTHAGGASALVWRTADAQRGCQFDLTAAHLVDALSLTDLDEDGIAESTFLYTLTCRSDVSPATRKLLMHEGADKYAVRGTTRIEVQNDGGEMAVDPAFDRAPPSFREYAVRRWKQYVTVDF